MDDRDTEYFEIYLEDTDEHVESLHQTVATWRERMPEPADREQALRLLHAMEGAAGAMRLENVRALTKTLHTHLERVLRQGGSDDLEPLLRLLRGIVFLGVCNQRLRAGEPLADAASLVAELQTAMDRMDSP